MPEFNPPFIFAHRGASANMPENSLAAFELAVQQGAQAIELDVHLTADEQIVVLHDDTVDATTNGHGAVEHMTLAQLRALQVHPRKGSKAQPAPTPETIPLLAEVIERVMPRLVTLNIEIKASKSTALAEGVARLVQERRVAEKVLISSFDRYPLAYLQQHHPTLRRALLYPSSGLEGMMVGMRNSLGWITGAHALGCEAIHPYWRLASRAGVERAHLLGLDVNVWTVDDEAAIRQLVALDVDGIITNDPARVRAALATLAAAKVGS
jgi:glycerophosphoryl diester phosphodiesterase